MEQRGFIDGEREKGRDRLRCERLSWLLYIDYANLGGRMPSASLRTLAAASATPISQRKYFVTYSERVVRAG